MAYTPGTTPGAGVPPVWTGMSIASADGGHFDAYVAKPEGETDRAVVVLQEIFGVTRKVRAYADMFAREGYLAVVPDLFWRMERGVELAYSEGDVKRAMDFLARYDESNGMDDVKCCIDRLSTERIPKIAVVGYCLGGKLAGLAAARGIVKAGVAFYGVGLEKNLEELSRAKSPLQMHFGAKDDFVPATAVTAIQKAVVSRTDMEVHVYPEGGHAFFRPDLKDPSSATAWPKVLAFLREKLEAAS